MQLALCHVTLNCQLSLISVEYATHIQSRRHVKAKGRSGNASLGLWLFSQGQKAYKPFYEGCIPGNYGQAHGAIINITLGLICLTLPLNLNIKYRFNT